MQINKLLFSVMHVRYQVITQIAEAFNKVRRREVAVRDNVKRAIGRLV